MGDSIIVENVSKKFDIRKLKRDTQFREALISFAKRTFLQDRESKEEMWALKNVSFSVGEGEVVGIIGRNGAGKSTLLKILSKITYPSSGQIRVQGRVGSLLEVGTGFHEELTGRENIYLNGSILGMRGREVKAKLDAIVAFAEVGKFLDTPIKHYSSGMRLRLGFSVAAHLDTDILFIDEVLAVGDVGFQRKCLNLMGDLHKDGRTVLFISHSMPMVESLCPRVIWLADGHIQQDGHGAEVVSNYMSQFAVGQQASGPDLTHFFEREGSGEVRYTRMEFLDCDGEQKKLIRSGDSLRVRLYYRAFKAVRDPNFNFIIYTENRVKVATFKNLTSGQNVPSLQPGDGYADLDIECLNIMPDRYFVNLCIVDANDQYIDHLVHCSTFDVEGSNYYQTGRGINKLEGITFLRYSWRFVTDCPGPWDGHDSAPTGGTAACGAATRLGRSASPAASWRRPARSAGSG